MEKKVEEIFEELFQRYPDLKVCKKQIWDAYVILSETYHLKRKLLIAGNGGSASDAEHIVGELMKSFVRKREISHDMMQELKVVNREYGEVLADKLQGALPAIAVVDGTINSISE